MRNRLISLFVALSMLVALFPVFELTAFQAEIEPIPEIDISFPINNTKYYQGDDLTTIAESQWTNGTGNYSVNKDATNNVLTIHAVEKSKGTTASYVLQPFSLFMRVPARTAYTVAFKVSVVLDRGSKGASEWFAELEDSY